MAFVRTASKLALTAALFAAAMALRARNHRLDEGGGVFAQAVFSLWFLGALAWKVKTPEQRRGLPIAVALIAGVVLSLSWLRVVMAFPFIVAAMVVFLAVVATERFGRRSLWLLVLLAPLGLPARGSIAQHRRLHRVEHIDAAELARASLASPDGRVFVLEEQADLESVAALLRSMSPRDHDHEGITDAWTGTLELRDGTKEPWQLGQGSRYKGSLWVVVEGMEYRAPLEFPAAVHDLVDGKRMRACRAAIARMCMNAAQCSPPTAHIHIGPPDEPGSFTIAHESEASCVAHHVHHLCRSPIEDGLDACAASFSRGHCEDAARHQPRDRALRATGACAASLRVGLPGERRSPP